MRQTFIGAATSIALAIQVAACGDAGADNVSAGGAGGDSSASGPGGSTTTSHATGGGGAMNTGGAPPAPAPYGCVTEVGAGHHGFQCDDIVYDVEIPDACAAGGCGLVLDLPGYTSNAGEEDLGTGMRALGRQHGYVIVQPTAPGVPPTWTQAADNPKIMAFTSDAAQALAIDPKRVHAMGFSQGGALVWGLICGYTDVLASASSLSAASPWSGVQGCDFVEPNVPSRPLPVLQVHGHLDNTASFGSFALAQLAAATKYWMDGPGTVFQSGAGYQATRFAAPDGTPYEFWEHDYTAENGLLGHCFPGGAPVGSNWHDYGCAPPNGFVYGEVAMQFFIDHPRNEE